VLTQLGQHARALQALQWEGAATPATHARRALLRWRLHRATGQRSSVSLDEALASLGGSDPLVAMHLRLDASLALPATQAVDACAALVAEAERLEHLAVAMRARLLLAHHLSAAGRIGEADAADLAARLRACHPADTGLAEAWWIVARAHDAAGAADGAADALREGFSWIVHRALPHVPPAWRESFLQRQPAHRDLLAAAANRLSLRARHRPTTPGITPG
jgi:hypothetical protein